MNCLTTTQIALYLSSYGLSEEERETWRGHLAECRACQDQLRRMQKSLEAFDSENGRECARVRDDLAAHAFGDLPESRTGRVLRHVADCGVCSAFLKLVTQEHSYQEILALNIPAPGALEQRLRETIDGALAVPEKSLAAAEARARISGIAHEAREWLTEIRLSLSPIRLAAQFRGEDDPPRSDFVKVEHAGGNLAVRTSKAGVRIELYSLRKKFLDDIETDAGGQAVFVELKPGKYYLRALSHNIDDIRISE